MDKDSEFSRLRAQLDNAITYGSRGEALKIANEGLKNAKKRSSAAEIEYFKGQIELLHDNFASAIEHFDAAIKHNPSDGASYNDRALCMVEMGIIDEAFSYFDKGIEVEPDYATIYHNKGWLLNNIGKHSEAIGYFNKALSLEPQRPVTYDNLADALLNLGEYEQACLAYRKVLELLEPGSCKEIREQIAKKIKEIERRGHGLKDNRMEE